MALITNYFTVHAFLYLISMRISIIGTGYVGTVTGACFARLGNEVTCVDVDQKRVDSMNKGIPPIYEEGLEELLKTHAGKNLKATLDYDLAIENFEQVLVYKTDTPWGYYYLAQAYEANNDVDKAISNYLKAITTDETFYPAYKKVAILFLARNDFEDAIEYFEDYIKLGVPEEEEKQVKQTIERIKKVQK